MLKYFKYIIYAGAALVSAHASAQQYAAEVPELGTQAGVYGQGVRVDYVDPSEPRKPYILEGHVRQLADSPWVREQLSSAPDAQAYLNKPSAEDIEHWQKKTSKKKI